ncbi:hypothetical protein LCGC14_1946610 [marine sediment metagenome]|uniref:Uncharacterized protein n=1 Tax=marine sediment metagenome TaxID=412755 RepID=A0A0F9FIR2_9ZZZZ
MSCGIICRQDAYSPYAELARIQRIVDRIPGPSYTPKRDWIDTFELYMFGGLGAVAVIGGIGILSTLAYVAISAIVAAL